MDDIVKNHLRHIRLLQKEIAELESETALKRFDKRALTEQLQALLAEGKSTGDPLWDLVIRAAGPNRAALKKYRALQKKLTGKTGEFVVTRYAVKARERCGGDLRSSDFRPEVHFRIGLLADDKLTLSDEGSITLPVARYLAGTWPKSFVYKIVADTAPVSGDLFERLFEDDPPTLWKYLTDEHLVVKDLIIGDEGVRLLFEKARDAKFFATAAERLGRLILQAT